MITSQEFVVRLASLDPHNKEPTVESPDLDQHTLLNRLNEALAREIVSVLRYKRQESTSKATHAGSLAAEFQKFAFEGQKHVELLANDIVRLGKEPNFTPIGPIMNSHANYIEGRSLPEMIKEDWVAERLAIDFLSETIGILKENNLTTREMIKKIIFSKKSRTDYLIFLLSTFNSSPNGEASHQKPSNQDS